MSNLQENCAPLMSLNRFDDEIIENKRTLHIV